MSFFFFWQVSSFFSDAWARELSSERVSFAFSFAAEALEREEKAAFALVRLVPLIFCC
jgi:hypothetical protein